MSENSCQHLLTFDFPGLARIKLLDQADPEIIRQKEKLHTAQADYAAALDRAAQSPDDQSQTRKLRTSQTAFEKVHKKSEQMAKACSKGSGQVTIWLP